ncbi:MAG TPA: hypothetical protein VFN05_10270 [Actinomycetes bacterium]|nr:hypothetical protein [Actinomycetes bacterium]
MSTAAARTSKATLNPATPSSTRRVSPSSATLISVWGSSRWRSPIRRDRARASRDASTMKPRPPVWTRARITTWPKPDQ